MIALEPQNLAWLSEKLSLLVFSFDGAVLAPFSREAARFLPSSLPTARAHAALRAPFDPAALQGAHRARAVERIAWSDGDAYVVPVGEESLVFVHPEQARSMREAMVTHDTSHALGLVLAWSRVAEASEPGAVETAMRGIRGAVQAARMALEERPEAREVTRVSEVVDEVLALLEPLATQRKLRVEVSLPPDLVVHAARSVVYRALWNLIENAYTALGVGQLVRVEGARLAGRVELRVVDEGPGVPARLIPTLFTKRPEAGRSRGIGLAGVAESLAEAGGGIRFEAPPGGGACFIVELPAADAPGASGRSGVRARALAPRVLVVEDDPALLDLLSATFELEGLSVEPSPEALPDDTRGFDIALIDLHLRATDGLTLVSELRRRGFEGALHLMSGGEPPPPSEELGQFQFHRKPFDPSEVARALLSSATDGRPATASSARS